MKIMKTPLCALFATFAALLCLYLMPLTVAAQSSNASTGTPTDSATFPIEHGFVNLANGDVHLEIPIQSAPQRGDLSTPAKLVYDSAMWQIAAYPLGGQIWYPSTNVGSITYGGTVYGAAWSLQYNSYAEASANIATVVCPNNSNIQISVYTAITWSDSHGTLHVFPLHTIEANGCTSSTYPDTPASQAYATDGSGYYAALASYSDLSIWDAHGTQVVGSQVGNNASSGATQVDRNGNYVTYDQFGDIVQDSLGRNQNDGTLIYENDVPDSNGYPYQRILYVPTAQGQSATYTITYSNIPVFTGFHVDDGDTSGGTPNPVSEYEGYINLVSSIDLPDGTSYTFSYDEACSATPCSTWATSYAELTGITLPHGGKVSLAYSSDSNAGTYEPARWVSSHTGSDGATSFAYARTASNVTMANLGGSVCDTDTNIVKNSALQTTYLFANCSWGFSPKVSYLTKTIFSPVATPTQVDAFVLYSYDFSTLCANYACVGGALPNPSAPNPLNLPICNSQTIKCLGAQWTNLTGKTVVIPTSGTYQTILAGQTGTGLITDTQYQYATPGSGIPTKVKVWDYYSGTYPGQLPDSPSGTATRETDTVLGETVNHALFPTSKTILDSTGATVQTETYTYDETAYEAAKAPSTTPNHDDTQAATNRGNVTTVTQCCAIVGGASVSLKQHTYYDDAGAVVASTDPNGNTTNFALDPTDTFVQTVTGPSTKGKSGASVAHVVQSIYDSMTGQLLSFADQNNQMTCFTYDSNSRLTTVQISDGQSISSGCSTSFLTLKTISYPTSDQNETDVSELQSPGVSISSSTFVDGYGRPSQQVTEGISTETTYDSLGRLLSVTNPHASTASSTDGKTVYSLYDELNRIKTVQLPNGNNVTYSYSQNNVTVTDPLSHSRQQTYDVFGDLTKVLEPDTTGALNWATLYTYNGLAQLAQVQQQGGSTTSAYWRTRTFSYDGVGRLQSQTTPEEGKTSFTYDLNGNLLTTASANTSNNTVTHTYDAENRILTEVVAGGPSYTFTYDAQDSSGDAYGMGLLTSTSNGANVQTRFQHDAMGNLTTEAYCLPSNCAFTYTATAKYDFQGNVTSISYPDSRVISADYDQLNRPLSVTYAAWNGTPVNTKYLSGIVYYPPGELKAASYGNGVKLSTVFDTDQKIASLSYVLGTTSLAAKTYTWDKNASNLTKIVDTASGRTQTYTYDYLDRLKTAADTGTTASATNKSLPSIPSLTETYTPDAWGNLLQAGTFTFNPTGNTTAWTSNRIVATGYVYDAAGHLTQDALGTTYQYRADGRLSGSNGSTYTYDALGQRIRKDATAGSTEYFFFGGNLVATRNPSTGAWTDLIYGGGSFLAEVPGTQTGLPSYRIGDHLDSLINTLSSTGAVTGGAGTSPYGQLQANTGNDLFPFTDHERDSESGTDATLFRHYSPGQSRWLSPDPYDGSYDLSDPQSFNRYAYLANRPLALIDALGLCGDDPDGGDGSTLCMTMSFDSQTGLWSQTPPCPCGQSSNSFQGGDGSLSLSASGSGPEVSSGYGTLLDVTQGILGLGGLIPEFGLPFNALNTVIDIGRGNTGRAAFDLALTFGSLVPGLDVGLRGAELAAESGKVIETAAEVAEEAKEVDGLADLAQFRSELDLAEGEGTLARLDVNGRSFYGINAHGQPITMSVNAISKTHAEADALQQALNAGVEGGDATLYVDRPLCTACGQNGGVRSMARQVGLDRLTVISPAGTHIIIP